MFMKSFKELAEKQIEVLKALSSVTAFPKIDIYKDDGEVGDDGDRVITINVACAGYKEEDLRIALKDNILSVFSLGKSDEGEKVSPSDYLIKRLSLKPFSVEIPTFLFGVGKLMGITYSYVDGVLSMKVETNDETGGSNEDVTIKKVK